MDNPGLRYFGPRVETPENFIKVTYRKVASPPPMATPYTKGDYGTLNEPATLHEDVEEGPSLKGGTSASPVGVDNGQGGADPDPVPNHHEDNGYGQYRDLGGYWAHTAGAAETMIPGAGRQHANPAPGPKPVDQLAEQNKAADQRRITEQKGNGTAENPAYQEAQQDITEKMMRRRMTGSDHPLFRGSAYDDARRQFVYDIDSGPDYYKNDHPPSAYGHGDQDMFQIKEPLDDEGNLRMEEPHEHPAWQGCQNCLHQNEQGDLYGPDDAIHQPYSGGYEHEYKPMADLPAGVRLAAQVPNFEDPAYPYSGRVDPEDTVDEHNLQSGDDTFRPHHPVVDSITNQMQGLPDMSRNNPALMDKVNDLLNSGPDTEENNRGADALAMGLNTIFDSSRETEGMPYADRLQAGKDAIDAHFEASKLTHKQHVKALHDDWEARGGHKTGEPRPVERFSPRFTKPQQIVPDPSNPFPELESPILYAGKCEGCGKKLYDSADSSGDPRGALGDHTVGTLDAREYDATDVPKEERTGERRMHGPSALICPECDNDSDRHNRVEDKYLGHKAGDRDGGGYWGHPPGSDTRDWKARKFIPTTYSKDRKGKWHNPGEKVGSCPECDQGLTGFDRPSPPKQASWNNLIREAHHDPDQDIKDVLAIQGNHGNWDYDPYMHGMFNGMELMGAIHERREPNFRSAPKHWGFEKTAGLAFKDYDGVEGNNTHITRNEQGMIPVDWVRNMPGARGEKPGEHRNAEGDEWEQFKQHVAAGTPGYSSPIFITVDHGGHPMINEGNHRRDAYVANGATHLPAEIRYFGHAERQGTVGDRAMRHSAAFADDADDPRGELEGLIGGLPEAGSPVQYTPHDQDHAHTLAEMGFGRHSDGDEPYWLRSDPGKDYVIAPGIEGYWETSTGPKDHWQEGSPDLIMPTGHTSFEEALEHMQVPPRAEPRRPGQMAPFQPAGRPTNPGLTVMNAVRKQGETDEEFWARQPDVVSTRMYQPTGPDATGQEFMEGGADPDWDDEESLEDILPRNTSLAEHAHVLRGGFRWDGDERHPRYTAEHWRDIRDADDRPAGAKEGQVIERNTHVMQPNLDEEREPLASPWMHTYYPAGASDDEGLVGAHNTAQSATRAAHQLGLWGARHPASQEILKDYKYVGNGMPYDPGVELPHEKAMR